MARLITKVNSRGEKRRRIKCNKGMKLNPQGTACVPITGSEKSTKRLAARQMVRTKRAAGEGLKIRTKRKFLKALKKRKALGYKR